MNFMCVWLDTTVLYKAALTWIVGAENDRDLIFRKLKLMSYLISGELILRSVTRNEGLGHPLGMYNQ